MNGVGVGEGVGVGLGVGVGEGVGDGVIVGDGVTVGVEVGSGVAVGSGLFGPAHAAIVSPRSTIAMLAHMHRVTVVPAPLPDCCMSPCAIRLHLRAAGVTPERAPASFRRYRGVAAGAN